MENEIKVNEFVRTKDGQIYKIEDGEEFYEDSVNVGIGIMPDVEGIWVDKEHFIYVDKREIVKHSPNLIDLIECGDYVNGKEVIMDLQKSKEWYKSKDDFITCKDYTFEENEIKEIVTKEQMESISYKVTKM